VPSAETADAIYDQIAACVADVEFRLLDRFNIEVISTTDSATSDLRHHAKLAADRLGEHAFPTFRPDALAYLDRPTWRADIGELAKMTGIDTATYYGFVDGLGTRPGGLRRSRRPSHLSWPFAGRHNPDGRQRRPRAVSRVLDGAEPSQVEVDAFAANMLY
jgi:glucuronate isomerase